MPVLFDDLGDGGGPRTFDRQSSGSFTGTHPGADGTNPCAVLAVTGYRTSGRAVTIGAAYADQPMKPTRIVWGNGVSPTYPNAGFLQLFYLLNPPTDPAEWQVFWTSPLGRIDQLQMRANSMSFRGVSAAGDLVTASGRKFTNDLEQLVDAPAGSLIVQGLMHEWFTPLSEYSGIERLRLDDADTRRPYDTIVGHAAGGQGTRFTAKRALGAAWAAAALPLIAAESTTITALPAQITVTGYSPHSGQNVITAPPAALVITGQPGSATAQKRIEAQPAVLHVSTYAPWEGLPVFSAGTVLTLRGLNPLGPLNPDDMPRKFNGIFNEDPYELHAVRYPASLASNSISKGVEALDRALHFYPPPFILLGQSQGAQVISAWLEAHRDDPNAPGADEMMAVLSGNPVSAKGGYLIGRPVVGGGNGVATPTDTKWLVIDVAIRYEGWTDWVQNENDSVAVQNAMSGRSSFHTRYDTVDLFDESHTIWRRDNTLFALTAAPAVLPYYKKGQPAPSIVSATRARIEAAYTNRPPNDPPVQYVPPVDTMERQLISKMLATP